MISPCLCLLSISTKVKDKGLSGPGWSSGSKVSAGHSNPLDPPLPQAWGRAVPGWCEIVLVLVPWLELLLEASLLVPSMPQVPGAGGLPSGRPAAASCGGTELGGSFEPLQWCGMLWEYQRSHCVGVA